MYFSAALSWKHRWVCSSNMLLGFSSGSGERKGKGSGSGGRGLLRSGRGIGVPIESIFAWSECSIVR